MQQKAINKMPKGGAGRVGAVCLDPPLSLLLVLRIAPFSCPSPSYFWIKSSISLSLDTLDTSDDWCLSMIPTQKQLWVGTVELWIGLYMLTLGNSILGKITHIGI